MKKYIIAKLLPSKFEFWVPLMIFSIKSITNLKCTSSITSAYHIQINIPKHEAFASIELISLNQFPIGFDGIAKDIFVSRLFMFMLFPVCYLVKWMYVRLEIHVKKNWKWIDGMAIEISVACFYPCNHRCTWYRNQR